MRIQWDYRYSLGVPELDNQHIKLFDMVNDLMSGIESNFRHEATTGALESFLQYAQEHFSTEERVMQAAGYPGYDEQKTEHQKFTGKMTELTAKVETDSDVTSVELAAYIMSWIQNHVLEADAQIGVFIKEQKKRR